jgi:hypothetical protein
LGALRFWDLCGGTGYTFVRPALLQQPSWRPEARRTAGFAGQSGRRLEFTFVFLVSSGGVFLVIGAALLLLLGRADRDDL